MQIHKQTKYENLRATLEAERATFIPHYRDLNDFVLPRRARFFLSDINKGDRRNNKIIDSTATMAARTLKAGMMTGITSPARSWFHLTTPDPDLADYEQVKQWLHLVDKRMAAVFLKSNLYQRLPTLYGDLGTFGTGAMLFEEDPDDTIRCQVFPVGSYCLGNDYKGRINTYTRTFRMTIQQLVEQFGKQDGTTGKADWSIFSNHVKTNYDNGNYLMWIDVVHIITPNDEYDPKKSDSKYKKFASCYYEMGKGYQITGEKKFLRESGYDIFPVFAPRWEVTGEDVYATDCPAMTALGDIKALQLMHKRKSQAIEKMVNPPMIAPTAMESVKTSILPSDITYFDEREGTKGFRPAHEINFRLGELHQDIQEHQIRIKKAFYEDIMLMFTESDRRMITAKEIEERGSEKFLVLGSVLEQLNQDLLNPMIDSTFEYMIKQGLVPPAPEELQGVDLKVEYVSVMAQAQKLVGLDAVNKFTQYVGNLAQYDPRALRKFNINEAINVYGDMTSVPPKMIIGDDEAMAAQQQAEQAAQQAQQVDSAQKAAATAKNLAQAPVSNENALGKILGL